MRHSPEPANHKCLLAVVVGLLVCFALYIGLRSDHDNDFQIRLQMLNTRSQQ